ncbi:MAG: HEAT repeat domain-containing protein [Planctomycetota bacterium]|jgi:HEAT repeat protein
MDNLKKSGYVFFIVVFGGLSLFLAGCKSSREEQAITWVKRMPQSPEDAQKWGVTAFSTIEEWVDAGRRIEGIEKTLIGILNNPTDEMLDENERLDNRHIIFAIGFVGSSNSIPVLIRIIEDKNEFIPYRIFAATALGGIGDPLAVEPLCRIVSCNEESDSLRANAIAGLGKIGDPNAIPVIENTLKNQQFSETYKRVVLNILKDLKQKESQ